ncbi:MAG: pH regulation protein F [Candidatus Competibacteraceae bacterium]|nr:pH regulation protein F [Candidatus Competibacteraceae bacterium]
MITPDMYLVVAVFLLANLLIGLARVAMGPDRINRLLATQLMTTLVTAILVLLAESLDLPALQDVALLFALLGALVSVAFVRLTPSIRKDSVS